MRGGRGKKGERKNTVAADYRGHVDARKPKMSPAGYDGGKQKKKRDHNLWERGGF